MSTTSFFYHTLGTINYQHLRTEYIGGKIYVHMAKKADKQYCTKCKSYHVTQKGAIYREIRTVPIGKKQIILCLHLHRLECHDCGAIRLEAVEIADPKKRYTRKLAAWVLDLLKNSTIKDVASITGLSWDQVKDIEKKYLRKKYDKVNFKNLVYISIDEFYIGKTHKYFTFVTDLVTGRIVYVGKDKGAKSLAPFFKKIRRCKVKIQAVAIDMGRAYIAAVLEHLPEADIVFDHFHVVKLINSKLDELRRKIVAEAESMGLPMHKGIRWAILKNPENLTDKQQGLLDQLLQMNSPLAKAYLLKEQFRAFWSLPTKEAAESFLDIWIEELRSIGAHVMNTLANTIQGYSFGLMNYFDHPITSAMMEGLNNKIRTMVSKAYGYRDIEFFKLKVKAIHRSRYALVG